MRAYVPACVHLTAHLHHKRRDSTGSPLFELTYCSPLAAKRVSYMHGDDE
jgi:hypothetical protein